MIEINLIKRRYLLPVQKRERILFFLGIFLPILFFSILMLLIISSVNKAIIANYSTRLENQKKAQLAEIEKILTPLPEEIWHQKELKEIAELLAEKYPLLSSRMVILSELTPASLFFTSINFEEKGLFLEGQGQAGNQTLSLLAQFLERLNKNPLFLKGASPLKVEEIRESNGIINFRLVSKTEG